MFFTCIENDKFVIIKHDNFQILFSNDVSNYDLIYWLNFCFC